MAKGPVQSVAIKENIKTAAEINPKHPPFSRLMPDTGNSSPFTGILIAPMALENRKGEIVCIPEGTQVSIAISDCYSDVSPRDIEDAIKLGESD